MVLLASLALSLVDGVLASAGGVPFLGPVFSLITLVPGLALGARRLHDIDKSGWFLLLALIPLIGALILLVWFVRRPDPAPNRFG
jgi:uncharacterized membrane protein YhaH (DUF805 family)